MRGHADLRAAVWGALLCALLALVLPFGPLRLVFAAPLTLFLPGYAIVVAVFARRRLDRLRLGLLSVGLSLAVLALGSLVLNYMPGGIRSGSWALLLVLVVLGACRVAALTRPAREAPKLERPRFSPSRSEAGLIAAGTVAGILAMVVAFLPMPASDAIGYSEMWIQPLTSSRAAGVEIGVGNRAHHRGSYELRVRFGGRTPVTVRELTLDPGEDELLRLFSAAPAPDRPLRVAATLFRQSKPDRPYRRVSAWIVPTEEAG